MFGLSMVGSFLRGMFGPGGRGPEILVILGAIAIIWFVFNTFKQVGELKSDLQAAEQREDQLTRQLKTLRLSYEATSKELEALDLELTDARIEQKKRREVTIAEYLANLEEEENTDTSSLDKIDPRLLTPIELDDIRKKELAGETVNHEQGYEPTTINRLSRLAQRMHDVYCDASARNTPDCHTGTVSDAVQTGPAPNGECTDQCPPPLSGNGDGVGSQVSSGIGSLDPPDSGVWELQQTNSVAAPVV